MIYKYVLLFFLIFNFFIVFLCGMLSINNQYIIYGCPVKINWILNSKKGVFFLWLPESNFFWKNLRLVSSECSVELIANKKNIQAKIIQLTFSGFKSIESISVPVHYLRIENIDPKLTLYPVKIKTPNLAVLFSKINFIIYRLDFSNFIKVRSIKFPKIINLND